MYTHPDVVMIEGYPLHVRSSVGLGPRVYAAFPRSPEALADYVTALESVGQSYYILGRMSNTLPPPADDGALYIFTDDLSHIQIDSTKVHVGAGRRLSELLAYLADRAIYLLPSLCGIPGSVGGAIYSNAGAYGECISDALESCLVFYPTAGELLRIERADMAFSYRHSRLQDERAIVLEGTFDLSRTCTQEEYLARRAHAIESRRAQQPIGKSLGSVFKKHEGVSIGKLIDEMGYKGRAIGGIFVSERHAGFLMNRGDGDVLSYRALMDEISEKIRECYGFIPEKEITVL